MPKTRKLALMAMFTAASLIVFVIEAQIPACFSLFMNRGHSLVLR